MKVIIQTDERCTMYEIEEAPATKEYIVIDNFHAKSDMRPAAHDVAIEIKDALSCKAREIAPPYVEILTGGAQ